MPKVSEEFVKGRRDEILEVCLKLYKTKNFKDITIKEIGESTTFTRTSIYNYFNTKEEIFLALFQREYELWTEDLYNIAEDETITTVETFADALAKSLERRKILLKLLSMNLYDMEDNCRLENVIELKKVCYEVWKAFHKCLDNCFPQMSAAEKETFAMLFFPFMYGIYPHAYLTDKQLESVRLAGWEFRTHSIYELAYTAICKLLQR